MNNTRQNDDRLLDRALLRLAELEAKGDYEASFALTSEMADWLMRSPEAMHEPLLVPPTIASLNP